jgi:hypothetical protein
MMRTLKSSTHARKTNVRIPSGTINIDTDNEAIEVHGSSSDLRPSLNNVANDKINIIDAVNIPTLSTRK